MGTLVSVIIPTHKRVNPLRRAIRSVEEQTYGPIELIVIGSPETGNIGDLVRSANIARTEFIDACARSPAAARNVGINHADGEWLAFLDDDDEWQPAKIERQLNRLNNTNSGVCHTGIKKIGPHGQVRAISQPTVEGTVTEELLTQGPYGTLSAMMIRKKIAKNVDGFDEELVLFEDHDFNIRVSQFTEFCTISDSLVHKHAGEEEQVTDDLTRMAKDAQRLIEKHQQLALNYGAETEQRMMVRIKHGLGRAAANQGMYSKARRYFIRALQKDPTHYPSLIWLALVAGGPITFRTAQRTKRRVVQLSDSVF